MKLAIRILCALALAVWLGGMVFFSAGVAPVAFAVLPTRVLAGNMVGGALNSLQAIAYASGVILLIGFALRAGWTSAHKLAIAKLVLTVLMLGSALYQGFGVAPPLARIRAEFGSIDTLPPSDPERVRFFELHQLSVDLMGANMLLAIALVVMEQLPEPV